MNLSPASSALAPAAHLLAVDSGLLHFADGATCLTAGPAYRTLAGMADSAECLRSRGADPAGLLADEDLLAALDALGREVSARWAR